MGGAAELSVMVLYYVRKGDAWMSAESDYRTQRQRIEKSVSEMEPGAKCMWDETHAPRYLRFAVKHESTGALLIESSGDWTPAEVGNKSDRELKDFIAILSGSRLRT